MEFSDLTNHKIELLDSVLRAIGVSSLFENPDFKIDEGSKGFHNLIINVYSDERITVPLAFVVWMKLLNGQTIMFLLQGKRSSIFFTSFLPVMS